MSGRIKYLHERGMVTAYLGEGHPYDLANNDAVILGTATRHLKKEGAGFSGWVVRVENNYSDPIERKSDAVTQLRAEASGVSHRYV